MRCAIWYHLYNLKNVKNTREGVLVLVKLQAEACKFTKINTAPWMFSTFFKLYKWYQIAQHITYIQLLNVFSFVPVMWCSCLKLYINKLDLYFKHSLPLIWFLSIAERENNPKFSLEVLPAFYLALYI